MSDLEHLDQVLREADEAHAADVEALADLDNHQIGYLHNAGTVEDPLTDGIEARCPA